MDLLPRNPATIDDVRQWPIAGPWPTKSGGLLSLPLAMSREQALKFLDYDPVELGRIPVDIRGLRIFYVHDVPAGGVGGKAFHRARTEISFVVKGAVRWLFEDLRGRKKETSPEDRHVVFIPPFILHSMKAEADETIVATLANTLFLPDDPATHDTYPDEIFRSMQDKFRRQAERIG